MPVRHTTVIDAVIYCPYCRKLHIDEGKWAEVDAAHRTHLCAFCKGEFIVTVRGIDAVQKVNATILSPELERAIRLNLWLNHGHTGQYGDDGEMQCAACIPFGSIDYRRDPIEDLLATMRNGAMARLAEHMKKEQPS